VSRKDRGLPPLTYEDSQKFVLRKLNLLQERKFHGKVTLNVQDGHVLRIEVTEVERIQEFLDGESSSQSEARCEPDQGSSAQAKQACEAG